MEEVAPSITRALRKSLYFGYSTKGRTRGEGWRLGATKPLAKLHLLSGL